MSDEYTYKPPSDSIPADMPTDGIAGVLDDVSRADHIHPFTKIIPMSLEPSGGASIATSDGLSYLLDAAAELLVGAVGVDAGYARFRLRIHYKNSANKDLTVYIGSQACGVAGSWDDLSNSTETFTSTGGNLGCLILGWYTLSGDPELVRTYMASGNTTVLNIYAIDVEVDTESS